jgi:hypothetical protein
MKIISSILYFILTTGLLSVIQGCGGAGGSNSGNSSMTGQPTGKAVIAFSSYEHDFGRVPEGKTVRHNFSFVNEGDGNLSVFSAVGSCGCTVSRFDKKPIPPGKSGNIEVAFDTRGRSGKQTKTISVKSNALKPVIILKISAEVVSSNNN